MQINRAIPRKQTSEPRMQHGWNTEKRSGQPISVQSVFHPWPVWTSLETVCGNLRVDNHPIYILSDPWLHDRSLCIGLASAARFAILTNSLTGWPACL